MLDGLTQALNCREMYAFLILVDVIKVFSYFTQNPPNISRQIAMSEFRQNSFYLCCEQRQYRIAFCVRPNSQNPKVQVFQPLNFCTTNKIIITTTTNRKLMSCIKLYKPLVCELDGKRSKIYIGGRNTLNRRQKLQLIIRTKQKKACSRPRGCAG